MPAAVLQAMMTMIPKANGAQAEASAAMAAPQKAVHQAKVIQAKGDPKMMMIPQENVAQVVLQAKVSPAMAVFQVNEVQAHHEAVRRAKLNPAMMALSTCHRYNH